ncbi:MAG TPA: AMP-binding protein [Pseudonocardiaceae bacterium]|jgi:fatty-acyl-CoA synthase|nr:AMP-binding protein [Pseudonocardiaceae bacterium]
MGGQLGGWRQVYELISSIEILRRRGLIRPHRISTNARTLRLARKAGPFAAMIAETAHDAPESPAIVGEHGTLSYGELERKGNALAHGLRATGITSGDIAGFLCRDDCGMVLALVAAGKLGVRVVFLNTGFGAPQLQDVLQREKVTALFLDSEFVPLTAGLPPRLPRILTTVDDTSLDATNDNAANDNSAGAGTSVDDRGDTGAGVLSSLDDLIAGRPTVAPPLPPRPGGMVLLTSGTTGKPRGAPRERISPMQSAQILDRIPLSRGGTLILGTPLFHGTGLGQFVVAMTLGKKVLLRRRFDPELTLAAIARHRADTLIVVPTMLKRLLDLGSDAIAGHDTSSLRIIVSGGSALAPDLCRRSAAAFGDVLHNVYGSTEVANTSVATPAELRQAPGTVGRPPVGCRLALYDDHRNPVTGPNRRGTIFASSGLSFAGYTDGSNKEVVAGMVSTGDVGHFDENGLLFIDGRDDEMIVSGGENVFPVEVENLLIQHAEVRDAAVVGVDDAEFGKRLRAFIVASSDVAPDPDAIKDYVRANLARYKVPRDVIFVDELPRNAAGKLLRVELEGID